MVNIKSIIKIANTTGYQFLGGVTGQQNGYALGHLRSDQPVTICKTLDEVLEFLMAHQDEKAG